MSKVINTITVGPSPDGISSDGTNVWVNNTNNSSISKINCINNNTTTIENVPVVQGTTSSSDGTNLWIICQMMHLIMVLFIESIALVLLYPKK